MTRDDDERAFLAMLEGGLQDVPGSALDSTQADEYDPDRASVEVPDVAPLPDETVPTGDPVRQFSTVLPDDPSLSQEEAVIPDHTASRDPISIVERVKARARNESKDDTVKAAPKGRTAKKAVPKTRPGALVEPLTNIYTTVGVVLTPFDPLCATAVLESANKCAVSLDALAQRNDAVRRALLALTETSAWGGVVAAHLPILLMVASHHGPKDVAEIVSPLAFNMNPGAAQVAQDMHPSTPKGETA